LWAWLRHQQHLLRWAVADGVQIAWLPPQEQPDDAGLLALEAAFRGDGAALARYRALHGRPASTAPPDGPRQPPLETDYTLVLGDASAVGALAGTPVYRLWTRDGRSREGYGVAAGAGAGTEATAWATVQAALEVLVARIERRRRDPARYSLTVYSSQEAVVAALRALAPGAPASRRRVAALLGRFGTARVLWQPASLLAAWLARADS
jgi:hypothetical protein